MAIRRFRSVVSFLLPLIAAALCAAQAFPSAAMSRALAPAGHVTAGAVTTVQSVSANKTADATAVVVDDWSSLFSKPSSPVSKAPAALTNVATAPALDVGGAQRPLPGIGVRPAVSSQPYHAQAPPASSRLA